MTEVRTAHTADLDAATLRAARALLDDVFRGRFSDHDWEHALGGVHALAWEDDELSGTRPWSSGDSCTADARCARAMSRASASASSGAEADMAGR